MAWPNDPCPQTGGPTAAEHLQYIRAKASVETAGPLKTRILSAIDACMKAKCALTGNPPQEPIHCQRILWARALASESNWGQCANELEHGV